MLIRCDTGMLSMWSRNAYCRCGGVMVNDGFSIMDCILGLVILGRIILMVRTVRDDFFVVIMAKNHGSFRGYSVLAVLSYFISSSCD